MWIRKYLAFLAILTLASGGCTMPKERYLISYYSVASDGSPMTASQDEALNAQGGRLIVPPIRKQGLLENPATPDYT